SLLPARGEKEGRAGEGRPCVCWRGCLPSPTSLTLRCFAARSLSRTRERESQSRETALGGNDASKGERHAHRKLPLRRGPVRDPRPHRARFLLPLRALPQGQRLG